MAKKNIDGKNSIAQAKLWLVLVLVSKIQWMDRKVSIIMIAYRILAEKCKKSFKTIE